MPEEESAQSHSDGSRQDKSKVGLLREEALVGGCGGFGGKS